VDVSGHPRRLYSFGPAAFSVRLDASVGRCRDFRAGKRKRVEHLKLAFWPMLVWWLVGYLLLGRKKSGSPARFAVTCAISEVVCLWFIVAFFYTYTGAFGIESLALDILSLFLGLVAAVLVARHVIIHTKPGGAASFLAVVVLLVLAAAFAYFTLAPPHVPLFQDSPTGTYGIGG
jgi:hypothetical protein